MSAWFEEANGANIANSELHPPQKRIRSAVWRYFGFRKKKGVIVQRDWPICRACSKVVPAKTSNTSNLIHHLREHHPTHYAEMQNMKHPDLLVKLEPNDDPVTPNPRVMDTLPADPEVEASSKWVVVPVSTDSRQVALTDSIVTYIVNGLLPLSTVENKDFITVLQLAEPLFTIPSRRDLTQNLIPQRTAAVKNHLINQMQNTCICLTLDIWSNRSMRSFFAMTGNFISNFTLQNVMLSCQRFKGRHSTDSICAVYEDILSTYEIKNKVSFIVTDSASNIIKAFTLFPSVTVVDGEEEEQDDTSDLHVVNTEEEIMYFPPERSPCFVYTVQLVVRDALNQVGSVKNLLGKIQKLVSFCHKSPLATEILGDYRLHPGNATRWNSQLKILKSVLNIPSDVLAQLECPVQLSPTEFKIVQELCVVLEPFEEVTDRCQAEKVVTSGLVIPCVRALRHAVRNMKMTGSNNLVSILQKAVDKHLAKFEEMQCFQMASTLDPRFKLDWCIGEEVITIKDRLMGKVECLRVGYTDYSAQPKKRPKLFSYMESQSCPSADAKALHDVIVYLNQPCLAEDVDPLAYWKGNQTSFPELAQLACQYLAIPASSAPVERIFSAAGSIFRPGHCNINDKTFEDLLLIKCNNIEQ
uniref:Zinc finger BED domain-containing protein 1-like n=1 Tax=Paramormyrops kingsleyae TaxID=1676925 RepID=A0A3B3RW94_9TELE|nr:zinc finger BED domain-containing protein 1-like [Paramormyrops kingsleyae]